MKIKHLTKNAFTDGPYTNELQQGRTESRYDDYYGRGESREERYRRERNEWRIKFETLEQQSMGHKTTIEYFQAELQKEQGKVERTKRSAHDMQTELDNKELFLGQQATDDEIRASFGSIMASIKTWSTNFTAIPAISGAFKEEDLVNYQNVVPRATYIAHFEALVAQKKEKTSFRERLGCLFDE